MVTSMAIATVAVLHIVFLIMEMFLWTKPSGRRIFGITREFAEQTKVLAANQGLYNGFLAAGLLWGLIFPPAFKRNNRVFSCLYCHGRCLWCIDGKTCDFFCAGIACRRRAVTCAGIRLSVPRQHPSPAVVSVWISRIPGHNQCQYQQAFPVSCRSLRIRRSF